jgi:hypothetical protein
MSQSHRLCLFSAPLLLWLSVLAVAQSPSVAAAAWEPIIPDQGFPASILSTGGVAAKVGNSPILCDPRSSFRVRMMSPAAATHVHVEVMVDGFFLGISSCDAVLENAGQQYIIAPTPRWDMNKLRFNDQPSPATVVVSVKANGVDLGQKTERLQIRAVNDVPFSVTDSEGNVHDQSNLFAAFVNENSPVIDELLHEALRWHSVPAFNGYQRQLPESVRMQVFAVWNALQHRHVKYSSITTPSGFSEKVHSQTVRFVSQTIRMSEANCVDGSVLFASVLYKIGIFPVLVKKPGHMFVGYYLDRDSVGTDINVAPTRNLEFLETTVIGNGPPIEDQPFRDQNSAQSSASFKAFLAAVRKGNEEFWSDVQQNWIKGDPRYRVMSIRNLRQKGINPIPR